MILQLSFTQIAVLLLLLHRLRKAVENGNKALRVRMMTGYGFFVQCFVSCKPEIVSLALLLGGNNIVVEILNYDQMSF